jgi:hypothetical protein
MPDDGEIGYAKLIQLYEDAIASSPPPNILRWAKGDDGIIYLLGEGDAIIGMTSQEGLKWLLGFAEKAEEDV